MQKRKFKIDGIVGFVHIFEFLYICVITQSRNVGCIIPGQDIYFIEKVKFFPILPKYKKESKEAHTNMKCMKKYFMSGFYYSRSYNLLISRERFQKLEENEKVMDWTKYDNDYYWNYNMSEIKQIPPQWRTIVIQGYFFQQQIHLEGKGMIKLGCLSRRQCKRGGTRLNARGIDDSGYVGNFIETESFIIIENELKIFTQIRGSIPLFWKQEGLQGAVKFKRDPSNSLKAMKKHFHQLQDEYGSILMVNLLKTSSAREDLLSTNTKNLLDKNIDDIGDISYHHFDFHANGIKNLHKILDGTKEFIRSNKYYSEEIDSGNVTRNQNGVIRTNCMD